MKPWKYEPAGDLGLPPTDRWRSTRRENGYLSWFLQQSTLGLAAGWLRSWHRLEIVGREHLPAEPPFVLVANHASHLDIFALITVLPGRWRTLAYAVSAGDTFFKNPASSWVAAHALNALPLWRRGGGTHALQDLRKRLCERQEILVLFPEGTRTRSGVMGEFKSGIGRVVAGTPVPVVPCFLEGCYGALAAGHRWPRPCQVKVRVGEPLRFEQIRDEKAGWLKIREELQEAVRKLAAPTGG